MKQKSYFLPLNGADFDQGGSCSWSPGGQLAATPWPLPTAPWPPTAQLASLTSPPSDQWGLASFALGQSERLIAGLRLAPPMGGLDRWPRAGTLDRDRWLGSAHQARTHTSCRHYRDPQIASKKGETVCFLSLSFGLWRYCALGQSTVEKVWLELGLMISWTWSCWWYVLNFRTKYTLRICWFSSKKINPFPTLVTRYEK